MYKKYKSKAQRKRATLDKQAAWMQQHMKAYTIRFLTEDDADILEELEKQESKIDFLRKAIRAYIKK